MKSFTVDSADGRWEVLVFFPDFQKATMKVDFVLRADRIPAPDDVRCAALADAMKRAIEYLKDEALAWLKQSESPFP